MKGKTISINNYSIFYREAGNPENETILLLHGFPSSSHMYREIINELSDKYHLVAPDYIGFGLSDMPLVSEFEYTFENIAKSVSDFIETLGLKSFYLLMHDYGGPIGFRIATTYPSYIKGLIIQNANAYMEGIGEWGMKIGTFKKNNDIEGLLKFKDYLISLEGLKDQYLNEASNPDKVDPISYLTDKAFLNRTNANEVQTALFSDYGSNFPKYTEWQEYFKNHQPKTLVLWGKNDRYFNQNGAKEYSKDLQNIEMHFFEGGHFMLEEYAKEATELITNFIN
ncbi:alpha/beta fold hydrolase [Zobellia uliginosa]|uniref:alpha/beta fold hydrolase n=1 Tax=Zobellia uliginosa TaxID=143224 RepID=UPI001C0676E8|nr:alpha/beta fold hydrolase [Zobellia uliginosa]MBU2947046.1 alpha/beta fold hydrolase [Zobellia uliginosa]